MLALQTPTNADLNKFIKLLEPAEIDLGFPTRETDNLGDLPNNKGKGGDVKKRMRSTPPAIKERKSPPSAIEMEK